MLVVEDLEIKYNIGGIYHFSVVDKKLNIDVFREYATYAWNKPPNEIYVSISIQPRLIFMYESYRGLNVETFIPSK